MDLSLTTHRARLIITPVIAFVFFGLIMMIVPRHSNMFDVSVAFLLFSLVSIFVTNFMLSFYDFEKGQEIRNKKYQEEQEELRILTIKEIKGVERVIHYFEYQVKKSYGNNEYEKRYYAKNVLVEQNEKLERLKKRL